MKWACRTNLNANWNVARLSRYFATSTVLGRYAGTTYCLLNQKASTPRYTTCAGFAGSARNNVSNVSGAVPGKPRFENEVSPGCDWIFNTRLDPTTIRVVGRRWKTSSL